MSIQLQCFQLLIITFILNKGGSFGHCMEPDPTIRNNSGLESQQ